LIATGTFSAAIKRKGRDANAEARTARLRTALLREELCMTHLLQYDVPDSTAKSGSGDLFPRIRRTFVKLSGFFRYR
jgi:hypothetical protein